MPSATIITLILKRTEWKKREREREREPKICIYIFRYNIERRKKRKRGVAMSNCRDFLINLLLNKDRMTRPITVCYWTVFYNDTHILSELG